VLLILIISKTFYRESLFEYLLHDCEIDLSWLFHFGQRAIDENHVTVNQANIMISDWMCLGI